MLSVSDLHVAYGDVPVLNGVCLHVDAREIVSLVGSNGAGKTTLLKALAGLVRPREGRISFLDVDLTALPPHEVARQGIAQVMEGRRLFPLMTVEENLLLGGDILADRAARAANLGRVYRLFPILDERRRQRARAFSGGEQQMLAIGRALMASPKLLVLDEPSLGLAPVMVKAIFAVLRTISDEGMTILLAEQDVRRSLTLASRGYVIEQGHVVLEGASKDLLASPHLKKAYLGV